MQLTAEITLYPLQDNYLSKIKAFLEQLVLENTEIKMETFPTCTVLTGDYDRVMNLISTMMKWSYKTQGKSVFVTKFLPGYEAL